MPRGFVNGALGVVEDVYCSRRDHVVFTLLLTSGIMLLVHPICVDRKVFLPCSYGYAVTVRKAQGASLDGVVCDFELFKPLERGFAYVALSRARRRDMCYRFGRIRRTDWLPAEGDRANEQTTRSVWSEASLLLVFFTCSDLVLIGLRRS